MSTLLNFGRDIQGFNAFAPQFPTDILSAALTTNTPESITIPSNFPVWIMEVRLSAADPSRCWCSATTTASIPSGAFFSSYHSELIIPFLEYKRIVYAGNTISFITDQATQIVQVSLFGIGYP